MEEYVKVVFPNKRRVFINGKDNGETNEILRVDTGTHLFELDAPKNYKPTKIKQVIKNTNSLAPAEITFEKV